MFLETRPDLGDESRGASSACRGGNFDRADSRLQTVAVQGRQCFTAGPRAHYPHCFEQYHGCVSFSFVLFFVISFAVDGLFHVRKSASVEVLYLTFFLSTVHSKIRALSHLSFHRSEGPPRAFLLNCVRPLPLIETLGLHTMHPVHSVPAIFLEHSINQSINHRFSINQSSSESFFQSINHHFFNRSFFQSINQSSFFMWKCFL